MDLHVFPILSSPPTSRDGYILKEVVALQGFLAGVENIRICVLGRSLWQPDRKQTSRKF